MEEEAAAAQAWYCMSKQSYEEEMRECTMECQRVTLRGGGGGGGGGSE